MRCMGIVQASSHSTAIIPQFMIWNTATLQLLAGTASYTKAYNDLINTKKRGKSSKFLLLFHLAQVPSPSISWKHSDDTLHSPDSADRTAGI